MKFLIHSNAPSARTGYGVQTGLLAQKLIEAGHEPAVSATFGCEGAIQTWRGVRIYPRGYERVSNDVLHLHAGHWFENEPGWIITLVDVWSLITPRLADFNCAAWVPIDHFPIPPEVRNFFSRSGAHPLAMSKYGHDLLQSQGLDSTYIPLSVDTHDFYPRTHLRDRPVRELFGIPADAFVVGMVAMNKGWARDRKGFNEAFWAFGQFIKQHPEAVLVMHTEKFGGADGQNLDELRVHAGIPDANIVWSEQYAYRVGYTPEMMAAFYSACDVLLAPSHGEGFCVPLIEAQACGTPVIATDFSAQPELVGAGWLLKAQPEWDPAQHAAYACPIVNDVIDKLELAYQADRDALANDAVEFAAQYDTQHVFETYWVPFLEALEATPAKVELDREPMPDENAVQVICPIFRRMEHVGPLVESFIKTTKLHEAGLVFVCSDRDDFDAVREILGDTWPIGNGYVDYYISSSGTSFAEQINSGYMNTGRPWVLIIGDDVRFHDGWLDAARKCSADYDVIGTNDTAGKVKNPKVASGAHADHFFVRRKYVEEYGACLDGPGILAPEAYHHWHTDMEIIKLAKARGVFTPCLESVVEHLHPAYDGREDLRQADPTYMEAVKWMAEDQQTFKERLPLIEQQRTTLAKL